MFDNPLLESTIEALYGDLKVQFPDVYEINLVYALPGWSFQMSDCHDSRS